MTMLDIGEKAEIAIGEARIRRDGEVLALEDPYSSETFVLRADEKVVLAPAPPLHVPQKVATHLLIELERPLIASEPAEFWVEAPYEIAVKVEGETIKYLSPVRVKHSLYGDIVDGVVCRYYRSGVYREPPQRLETASCKVTVEGEEARVLRKLVLPVENLRLYVWDGRVYYEEAKVELEPDLIRVVMTRHPPLREISTPPESQIRRMVERAVFEMMW